LALSFQKEIKKGKKNFEKEKNELMIEYESIKTKFEKELEEEMERFEEEKRNFFDIKKEEMKKISTEEKKKEKAKFEKIKFEIEMKTLKKRRDLQLDSFLEEGEFIQKLISKEKESILREYQIFLTYENKFNEILDEKNISEIEKNQTIKKSFQKFRCDTQSRERMNEKNQIIFVDHLLQKEKNFLQLFKLKQDSINFKYKDYL
jgi:hypothetical protein